MRAVFVALILNFQSAISAERTSIFRPETSGYDKIRLADFWKYILMLNWIHKLEIKSSRERETASFCSSLTPILQDKKQIDDQNQNIL